MSSWFEGLLICPYCNKETEFAYHIDMNTEEICRHCKKTIKIKMKFIGEKI